MRPLFLLMVLITLGAFGSAQAEDSLTTAKDLAALGQKAEQEGKPLVVFFYQEQCHYCEAVRKRHLQPMQRNPKEAGRIVLRQVNTHSDALIKDFEGSEVAQQAFAKRKGNNFTPTLAFYGPEGQSLTKPLVGLKGGRDYYGYYLEKSIEKAEAALRERL